MHIFLTKTDSQTITVEKIAMKALTWTEIKTTQLWEMQRMFQNFFECTVRDISTMLCFTVTNTIKNIAFMFVETKIIEMIHCGAPDEALNQCIYIYTWSDLYRQKLLGKIVNSPYFITVAAKFFEPLMADIVEEWSKPDV